MYILTRNNKVIDYSESPYYCVGSTVVCESKHCIYEDAAIVDIGSLSLPADVLCGDYYYYHGSFVKIADDSHRVYMTKVYLTPSAWDAETKTQTVSVEGILADETKQSIEVSPYNKEHIDLVTKYGIYCSGQGDGTLTFTAKDIPTEKVAFTIEWKDVTYQNHFTNASITLAENDWNTISAISKAGLAQEYWNIGDTIPVDINGTSYDFQIIGFDYDDVADTSAYGRSKAGMTLQMIGEYSSSYKMDSSSSIGGWDSSDMQNITLFSIEYDMPVELVSNIVNVNKLSYGSSDTTPNVTADRLFLLSESELTGTYSHSRVGQEGEQYQYFIDNGYTEFSSWLRTVAKSMDGYCMASNGTIRTDSVDQRYPISFAFCV